MIMVRCGCQNKKNFVVTVIPEKLEKTFRRKISRIEEKA